MGRPDAVFQQLVMALRKQIVDCCAEGQPVPSQRVLAGMHGVGQSTVHRAMRVLVDEGVVIADSTRAWRRSASSRRTQAESGLRIGLISRRARSSWENFEIYAALRNEARRRDVELVEVPHERKFRVTPNRSRV